MLVVTLSGDDLTKSGFVNIGRIPLAVALANGSNNTQQATRKIFAQINAGVQLGQLRPLSPETLDPLPHQDFGAGIVPFAELVAWGHSTKLYDFRSDWDERELSAAFAEQIYNGKLIDWRYWVDRMPQLRTGEAARLMSALDPVVFSRLDTRPNRNDPTTRCRNAEMMERLAERKGMSAASPNAWLEWADAEGFKVHDGFRQAVESSSPRELLAGLEEHVEKIDWSYWKRLPEVKVFEAVALIHGADPDTEPPETEEASAQYKKTLRLLLASLSDRTYFTPCTLNMGDPARHGVNLPEVGAWAIANGYSLPEQFPIRQSGEAHALQTASMTPRPMQRTKAQELAIVDAIISAGYTPKSLPKRPPGKPGVKAQIRATLVGKRDGLFPEKGTVFDKAWDRLRSQKDIADEG